MANSIADQFGVLKGIDPEEYQLDGKPMTKEQLDVVAHSGSPFVPPLTGLLP